jgi:multidrug efflux system membrane fusion protein
MPRIERLLRAISVACLPLLLWAGCGEEAPPPELPPRAIAWQRVSETTAGQQRVISGIVTAVDDTKLAFEVGGIVATVSVALGDLVQEGQELAQLDPEPFELAVSDGDAELADFRARRAAARADLDRTTKLFEADVASRQELEHAIARRDSLNGRVDAALARLNLARRDLRRSVLRAPFVGAVSVKDIEPAMKVASGQVVIEMDSSESGLRVEVQMPETLIAYVRQGEKVKVGLPSSETSQEAPEGELYPAVVAEVGTRAGTGNAFPVRADFREAPRWLRPGMTAEVHFEINRDAGSVVHFEGFLIPLAAAVLEGGGGFSVFVFDPQTSQVSKRDIRTGGVRDNDIAVLEGLEPGEIIATAGVSFLREGQEVRLLSKDLVRTAP